LTLRILIVGAGSIGERHLRCFGHAKRADLSICEIDHNLRQRLAGTYGLQNSFSGLGESLAHSPDAVVICTPAHLHVPMAIQAAEAGAHLLIEKPLSTSIADLDRLQAITTKHQLTVAVGYVNRVNPVLREMRTAIAAGQFGKPLQIVVTSGQHFPHYRPAYREIYYNDRASGGGAIQDALTHLLDVGIWLGGPVTEVAADAAHQALQGVTVEDTVHVIARHGTLQACYSLNQHQAPNESSITVVCERGTARFEANHNRWRWMIDPEQAWHDQPGETLERDDLFVRQADMFMNAIEQKTPVACSLNEAEHTLRVGLAILNAAETRTWVTV
jgi:predicted dehydrogenase